MSRDSSPAQTIAAVCFALLLHASLYTLSGRIKSASTEATPKQESVRVTIAPPKPAPQQVAPLKGSKVSEQKNKSPQPRPQVLTSKADTPVSDAPSVISQPQEASPPSSVATPPPPSSLLEERESPLLPSSKSKFMERQRKLGEVIGAGAIAGDLDVPDVVSERDPNSSVRRTEYTFAGYFDSLNRRFVEAWGGVRTLPPQSRFDGKVGEFIEYDVVINRDGSLRKIINITAKREPFRDFSAVDDLVTGVFQAMFPFQPVPERIQNDPLVIRKRIQFVGFKYTLY
ncbi:MAG: hypothetical protein FJY29_07270 [Betaproteobacteria bacterium]|nr:hypothetical protein [Betaproteobacteria bacterium]